MYGSVGDDLFLHCMCGDAEPNIDPSIYCPYPEDEYGTWNVQTEFINSKPGVAVYVGTSI